jgi:hypothetical protein
MDYSLVAARLGHLASVADRHAFGPGSPTRPKSSPSLALLGPVSARSALTVDQSTLIVDLVPPVSDPAG